MNAQAAEEVKDGEEGGVDRIFFVKWGKGRGGQNKVIHIVHRL